MKATKKFALFSILIVTTTLILITTQGPLAQARGYESEFKVLTLNTWLLKAPLGIELAKDIDDRLEKMPEIIASTDADVIGFQEVWDTDLRDRLIESLSHRGYAYNAFKESREKSQAYNSIRGLMGNGLLIVSKLPLEGVEALRFRDFTRPDEYLTHKGAIRTKVRVDGLGWIDFYNSHLGAVTFDEEKKAYDPDEEAAKLSQAKELYNWINPVPMTLTPGILTTDLNAHYQKHEGGSFIDSPSDVYRLFSGMIDTYATHNRGYHSLFFTFNTMNPYVYGGAFSTIPSEVEDYIFQFNPTPKMEIKSSRVVFYTSDMRISDHYGVLATFRIKH